MSKLVTTFIIGALLGVGAIKTYEYLSFQIPVPVAKLPDGAVYEGNIVDGVITGQGRMRWSNGDRYEGYFKDGLFNGQGKYEDISGFSYVGEFADGEMTGTGTAIYSEDERYTGEVLYGRMHGKGVFVSHGTLYEGEFSDHIYSGQGKLTDETGNTYTGQFQDGKFHGQGDYVATDGRQYSGEFIEGQLVGQGSYSDSRGARYEGEFKAWMYHGRGKLTTDKGDVYQGEFSYGQYNGKGTLTYAKIMDNIKQVSGIWRNGELKQADDTSLNIIPEKVNETVLYNQQELLIKSWENLAPNDPDKIDLYFLGISGDGSQAVFRREIEFVQNYFDENLNTRNKSVALINARKTIKEIPLATTTSIKSTLQEIAKRMDAENDILFIYMTSHGSREFDFSLKQAKMELPDISSHTLGEIMDDLPIRWKVIVVSACYSGGFIPPLKNDRTLIITAAASKQTSFGCSDDRDFTYFGEAYFKDALSQTNNFVEAFDLALEIVNQREESEGYEHSQPQIHKPDAIQKQLEQWRSGLAIN